MFLMKFEYPEFINKEAREISVKRSSKSKAVYKQKKRKRKNETEVSYRGVLAELIFTCILVKEKIEFKSAPLVAEKPVAEPDFIVGKYRIDVKAVNPKNAEMRVNSDSHRRSRLTHYVFILPDAETEDNVISTIYVKRYDSICKFGHQASVDDLHSDYYYRTVDLEFRDTDIGPFFLERKTHE